MQREDSNASTQRRSRQYGDTVGPPQRGEQKSGPSNVHGTDSSIKHDSVKKERQIVEGTKSNSLGFEQKMQRDELVGSVEADLSSQTSGCERDIDNSHVRKHAGSSDTSSSVFLDLGTCSKKSARWIKLKNEAGKFQIRKPVKVENVSIESFTKAGKEPASRLLLRLGSAHSDASSIVGKFVEGCVNMSTEEARRHGLNRDQIEVLKIKAFAYDQKRKHNKNSNGFLKGALPLRLSTSDSTGWTLSVSLPNGFKVRTAAKCGKSIAYKTTTDILSLGRGYKVAGVFVFNGYCDLNRDAESTFSISAKAIALTFIKSKSVQTEFNLDIDDLSDGDGSDSD